ncbi:MAG: DUF1648 domain-containing protein [Salibacteraceae bacterium]
MKPRGIRPIFGGLDIALEAASLLAVIVSIVLPIAFASELPDRIPIHFDETGHADRWGKSGELYYFTGIVLVIYIMLTLLNRTPHLFNYPLKITEENAQEQYTIAVRLLRWIKLITTVGFCAIVYRLIHNAMDGSDYLPPFWMFIFIGLLFVAIIIYFATVQKTKE